jgi:hypothetical protein
MSEGSQPIALQEINHLPSRSYFNSVFNKFANRAPANTTRCCANFAAFLLYTAVNVNGPSPAAIGAA